MAMHTLLEGWQASSITVKLAVVGTFVVIAAILVIGVSGLVSHYKDRAADAKQAELKAEGDEHRKRADEAEVKAKLLEERIKDQDLIIKAAGQKAEAAAAKVEDENQKFNTEMAAIGAAVDPCERVKRVCARLAIKPADCTCTAN